MTFNLDISFNAYAIFVFLDLTFHTLPNPPLPITYKKSKLFLFTINKFYIK